MLLKTNSLYSNDNLKKKPEEEFKVSSDIDLKLIKLNPAGKITPKREGKKAQTPEEKIETSEPKNYTDSIKLFQRGRKPLKPRLSFCSINWILKG